MNNKNKYIEILYSSLMREDILFDCGSKALLFCNSKRQTQATSPMENPTNSGSIVVLLSSQVLDLGYPYHHPKAMTNIIGHKCIHNKI